MYKLIIVRKNGTVRTYTYILEKTMLAHHAHLARFLKGAGKSSIQSIMLTHV